MKTVWTMPAPPNGEKGLGKHPTQKPIALVQRCLLASTNEGDTVLDPFLGSGTTALAAIRTGRKCVGIEWEPKCLDLSIARVEAENLGILASEPVELTDAITNHTTRFYRAKLVK